MPPAPLAQSQPPSLVLFTSSFPYDQAAEQTFLNPELRHLLANFRQVLIVPGRCDGQRLAVPSEFGVEDGYAQFIRANSGKVKSLGRALFSSLFAAELRARPALAKQWASLRQLAGFVSQAELTRRWLPSFMARYHLEASQVIFYTYWFEACATGLGLAKRAWPGLTLVTRAHGSDLYEERHTPPYIPCRVQSLRWLDAVFPDSDKGTEYLRRRYPQATPRCETARLGTPDPGFITRGSSDKVFRIVSCSFMVPVKRLDLLIQGIEQAALDRPDQQLEWHHFGTGPQRSLLEDLAARLPANVTSAFPGYSTVQHLMAYYRDNPIDVFVNVSQSEGTPVAAMEAISCGLPVIATAVGGNPEIVTEQNGLLLSPNPSPAEIAAQIFQLIDNPELARQKRDGSRSLWAQKYDADRNFQAFVESLTSIWRQAARVSNSNQKATQP